MKKLILFTALIGLVSCGSNTKTEESKKDTTPKVPVQNTKGLRIAYYYQDSIKASFDYYKKEDAAITKKQKAFQQEIERRTRELENFVTKKEQEAKSGLLSQNEMALAQQKAQQMEYQIMQYQQTEGKRLEELAVKSLEAISKKIEVLGKQYCEKHGIDILMIHGEGGQINYIHESMNVTREFINYLNENQAKIEKDLK